MKQYKVKVRYTYKGEVIVNARNKTEAIEFVQKHCGHIDGRGFHTVLDDDKIPNWEFPVHPDQKIVLVKTN